jgi:hypothetical protein
MHARGMQTSRHTCYCPVLAAAHIAAVIFAASVEEFKVLNTINFNFKPNSFFLNSKFLFHPK